MNKGLIVAIVVLSIIIIAGGYQVKKWKDRQEPILGYRPKFFNMNLA